MEFNLIQKAKQKKKKQDDFCHFLSFPQGPNQKITFWYISNFVAFYEKYFLNSTHACQANYNVNTTTQPYGDVMAHLLKFRSCQFTK